MHNSTKGFIEIYIKGITIHKSWDQVLLKYTHTYTRARARARAFRHLKKNCPDKDREFLSYPYHTGLR